MPGKEDKPVQGLVQVWRRWCKQFAGLHGLQVTSKQENKLAPYVQLNPER